MFSSSSWRNFFNLKFFSFASLESQITTASEVALISTRNQEEISRKLAMTQVELDRTVEKAVEGEAKIQVRR